MAGRPLHRWKLGFNQCRLHHASRTCSASRYIPSRLAAFLPCCFPLWVSPSGRVGVLRGFFALILLPLRGYLTSADAAHGDQIARCDECARLLSGEIFALPLDLQMRFRKLLAGLV